MDLTDYREQAARVGDQLAALAEHAHNTRADSSAAVAYAAGARAVARWVTHGKITPALQRLLDDVERHTTTIEGRTTMADQSESEEGQRDSVKATECREPDSGKEFIAQWNAAALERNQ